MRLVSEAIQMSKAGLSDDDDETFRKYCDHVIENSGDLEETGEQIKKLLGQKTG